MIPDNRKVTVVSGTQTVTLTRLTQPAAGGIMLVNVPVGSTGDRYVVAARTHVGHDSQQTSNGTLQFGYLLREQGVVIEKVSSTADTTNDLLERREGTVRRRTASGAAAETFTDAANGITIVIDRWDETAHR